MTREEFIEASSYWEVKDGKERHADDALIRQLAEDFILRHNTCALATGYGNHVRCTPIEYSYHDGCFWMFSEGGKKFIGLMDNPNVSIAIFDSYDGFSNLHGLQAEGKAELVEPFSEAYLAHANSKGINEIFLRKLQRPMYLICVHPTRFDCLFSDFKRLGFSPRQTFVL